MCPEERGGGTPRRKKKKEEKGASVKPRHETLKHYIEAKAKPWVWARYLRECSFHSFRDTRYLGASFMAPVLNHQ
jgi:hypothetical protein